VRFYSGFLYWRVFIQYLRLVSRAKCLRQINRENILSLGKQSLAGILIVSDYPPTSVINIFSNDQIYWSRHHPFSNTLPLSLSPSLSVSPLPCSLPVTFDSVFNPVVHYHLDHSINTFCKELFSFQRLHLYKSSLKYNCYTFPPFQLSLYQWQQMDSFPWPRDGKKCPTTLLLLLANSSHFPLILKVTSCCIVWHCVSNTRIIFVDLQCSYFLILSLELGN